MSNHQPSPHHGHGIESHGMVPTGWKRDLINGRIVYITPSNCALWSLDEVVGYLLSEGTCKCGLDCPLVIHHVFNFDPCTCLNHAQPGTFDTLNSNANLCNHKRKVTSIRNYQNELYQKNQAAELEQMYHQRNQSMRQDGMVTTAEMIQDGKGHPVIQQPQGVHYSLIVPTQQAATTILMSSHPQEQQMILSPHHGQLMSFGTIGHHHPHQLNHGQLNNGQPNHGQPNHGQLNHGHPRLNHVHPQLNHDNHVHHQQHPPPMISGSMFESVKQKKGVRKRNKSKMKTVAAMLKMKS